MSSPIINVSVRRSCSVHEGVTKHYALLLMSFQIKDSTQSHSMVVRMYGSLGKASRVNVEHFNDSATATIDYEQLLKEKHKRGYFDMFANDEVSLKESFLCEDSAEKLFLNPSLRVLMLNSMLTKNTKTESLSALLTHEEQEELADVVTALMEYAHQEGGTRTKPEPKKGFIAEAKAADNAILQLEMKRRETYGNEWGSW